MFILSKILGEMLFWSSNLLVGLWMMCWCCLK